MKKSSLRWALLGAVALVVAVPVAYYATDFGSESEKLLDDSDGSDWAGYGRTFGEQHYSPLEDINSKNISQLKLAWHMDLPTGNTVSQPIAIDGVIYFVRGLGVVHAVDAESGREIWQYDAKVADAAKHKMRYAWGARGIAWWNGKIYLGTLDGRLIAIDAKTGNEAWSVMTLKPDDHNYITGAPRVFDGKVVIGFGGADVERSRGYVTTYDAETGKQLWRFYTVPGNPSVDQDETTKLAAKTWHGEWWKHGGGGTVWNAMSYDPETDTLYLGTGNGTPWNHKARSEGKGDNLFLASIVALDGKSGKYKWHYQVNPGETWDFTATMDMAFGEFDVGGARRKVLMTAPKNGFFYVIDRLSGELLSAEPVAKVNWATHIDLKTGRPVEVPEARFPDGSTFLMWPSDRGAHSWNPMAYSPKTGLAYIPIIEKASTWQDLGVKNAEWEKMQPRGSSQTASWLDLYPKTDDKLDGTSKLLAWNAKTQKMAWSVATPGPLTGGVMATGGNLVFNGNLDGSFNAYAADTGKKLWTFQVKTPVIAAPITYRAKGVQYVSILVGPGTSAAFLGKPMGEFAYDYRTMERRLLTFAINGNGTLPPSPSQPIQPIQDPTYQANPSQASKGAIGFAMNCMLCHGSDAVSSGFAPDLRASPAILSDPSFQSIVREGAFVANGMPRFENLTAEQVVEIREYLRLKAAEMRRERAKSGGK